MDINGCLDWSEVVTALGAAGSTAIIALTQRVATAHPFVPTIFVTEKKVDGSQSQRRCLDADYTWTALRWGASHSGSGTTLDDATKVTELTTRVQGLLQVLTDVVSGKQVPLAQGRGATHFQIFRGADGHSV